VKDVYIFFEYLVNRGLNLWWAGRAVWWMLNI